MNKVINIVLNGPESAIPDLKKYDLKSSLWVGADRGALVILKNNLKLSAALGDFDSVNSSELDKIIKHASFFKKYPAEKDLTDFQISLLWTLKQKYKAINIFGWSEGRLDQFLSNLMTFTNKKFRSLSGNLTLIDKKNWARIYYPGEWKLKQHENKKYVCFTSLSNIKNLSLINLKYLLHQKQLPFGKVLSSNEFIKKKTAKFSFSKGILLVSQSND